MCLSAGWEHHGSCLGRRVAHHVAQGNRIMMSSPSLIGTWNLLSWEIRASVGTVTYPLGESPRGVIVYDESGRMAVQLMDPDRLPSESSDPFGAEPDEIVTAWMGFISYAGRYEVDSRQLTVTHHLEICSFPNWVGTEQRRFYEFDGDLLVLSTPPISLGGESTVSTLLWEPIDRP
jgi:hypothetical protein